MAHIDKFSADILPKGNYNPNSIRKRIMDLKSLGVVVNEIKTPKNIHWQLEIPNVTGFTTIGYYYKNKINHISDYFYHLENMGSIEKPSTDPKYNTRLTTKNENRQGIIGYPYTMNDDYINDLLMRIEMKAKQANIKTTKKVNILKVIQNKYIDYIPNYLREQFKNDITLLYNKNKL
jgi:hypothetical protein